MSKDLAEFEPFKDVERIVGAKNVAFKRAQDFNQNDNKSCRFDEKVNQI